MLILWKREKAFVKEIIQEMEEPRPAYNTVSTVVRILEQKGFVGYEAFGRSHQYHPLISQEEYSEAEIDKLLTHHFEGSVQRMLNFFISKKDMDIKDLDEVLQHLKKKS